MSRIYSEALVLRVNELFYDLIDDRYEDVHVEMAEAENRRWRQSMAKFVDPSRPLTIADIGSGAGLVGVTILDMLKESDTFVCADLSAGMLERARERLTSLGPGCSLDFRKIERTTPLVLPFDDESLDIVTMNSVLHHIKETEKFLQEIERVVKPGGIFLIGHEPNRRFVASRPLRMRYGLLKTILMPRHTLIKVAHRAGVYPVLSRIYYSLRPERGEEARDRLRQINATLHAEHLIARDLTFEEIAGITDIRDSEGFDPAELLPDFDLLSLETYNYMLLVSIKHGHRRLIGRFESALRRRYPDSGATFFAVFQKRRTRSH